MRHVLTDELRAIEDTLSVALGGFGADFHVDASDGITLFMEAIVTQTLANWIDPHLTTVCPELA